MFKNFKEKVTEGFKNAGKSIKSKMRTAQGNKERSINNIKTKIHKLRTDPYKNLPSTNITIYDGVVKSKPIGLMHEPHCITFNASI